MTDTEISYDLNDVFDAFPQLRAVAPFVGLINDMPWFRALGEPLASDVQQTAQEYAETLGFPDATPIIVGDWEDAAIAAEALDYNSPAWEAEETERARLTALVIGDIGEEVFELVTTHIAEATNEAIALAAEEARDFLQISDEAFLAAASGAATQVCHHALLTMLAAGIDDPHKDPDDQLIDPDTHPFMMRFRLFERGRWPIAIVGNSFNIF